ncbi:hypothetical protein O181_093113 [Austropuccinia psidii MF-1]|uniref:Uncharacterized protein n=1 Tax=Austropuccinia psidii MF-1 TaxID=1389203 RepID=A0A9Q3P921_9BASI|nr:hypothetical protein [Austropuccinia psidii MF-1]
MSSKFCTFCQARWAEFLSEFHFSITQHPALLATLWDALSGHDNIYLEREEDFINKNPMNLQKLLKKDEVRPSRFFSVKMEFLSNLIESIKNKFCQESQYRSILQELGKGKSVQYYYLDSSSQLLLFKDRMVVPNDSTIKLSILSKRHESSSWTPWKREDSQTCQAGFPLVAHDTIYQALFIILSTVLKKQKYSSKEVQTRQNSSNCKWSLDLSFNQFHH